MNFLVLAVNWWEPGQSNTFDVGDLSAIFMLFLAVVGAIVAFNRWWMKKIRTMIREEVSEFTKPIQPTANGGLSLPDVSRRVDSVEKILYDVKDITDENRTILLKLAVDLATQEK